MKVADKKKKKHNSEYPIKMKWCHVIFQSSQSEQRYSDISILIRLFHLVPHNLAYSFEIHDFEEGVSSFHVCILCVLILFLFLSLAHQNRGAIKLFYLFGFEQREHEGDTNVLHSFFFVFVVIFFILSNSLFSTNHTIRKSVSSSFQIIILSYHGAIFWAFDGYSGETY